MHNIDTFNSLALRHYNWVEQMNWHNRTVLESLALIGSEIGETMDECLNNIPTEHFAEELADICLRIIDVAYVEKVILKDALECTIEWKTHDYQGHLNEITIEWAKWINTARKVKLEEDFGISLGKVLQRVLSLAKIAHIDMIQEIEQKIIKNEARGSRGRVI